jgi:hypothetical protein
MHVTKSIQNCRIANLEESCQCQVVGMYISAEVV